ncbi:LOW QUALITY PROTEIN: glutactin [Drosophila gunungcola]|uniref:LOW QUALITY PROTEIN: glutactin n=1 Tax=Drosophila gunungcola TaxID=103775 RepID=UPI0022DF3B63|nr:LOW QUALITY PROTEIN: glutactin [Drosophila gunungcola]
MARFNGVLLLLAIVLLALFVADGLAQKNPNRQKQQRPGNQSVGNHRNKRPKPQQTQKQKPSKQKVQNVEEPKVFTATVPNLGRLRGRKLTTDWTGKRIMQFLDIPYGKAERFKPAEPAPSWRGVLPAHRPHAGCPSIQDLLVFAKLEEEGFDVEDCLRLTVNTKAMEGQSLPVMVYIHGDFFYDGDSVEAAPGYLLEQDVVLVSVRYRLGPFGFLSTLTDEMPGNAAVTDIILALKWVQKHIASFGGDPQRVTLFGQVGGAALVNVLTLSPAVPTGLFHRVIYQSGTALSPAFITDSPLGSTKAIGKIAGCKQTTKADQLNKCLSRLNATMLLAAFSVHGEDQPSLSGGAYGGVQLVIGGPSGILPEHPGRLLAAEKFQAYPTMGGSVKHGGTFMLRDIFADIFNETILDDKMSGRQYIDTIIEQANGADPSGSWKEFSDEEIFTDSDVKNGSFKRLTPGLIDLCSTISLKNPVLLVMQANAKKLPNSTYLYSFDYEGEQNRYATGDDEASFVPFDMGVSLTDDNLYLFPWPRFLALNSNRDLKVARRMVALWTSFATTGVPSAPGLPKWPTMSDETGPYMRIGRTVSFGDNYLDEYRIAVEEVKQGYSLVNEDYYDLESALLAASKQDSLPASNEEEDQDDFEGEAERAANEVRGQNLVFIARKSTRTQKQ